MTSCSNTCTILQVVDEWCDKLKSFPIKSLEKPLQDVARWHSADEKYEYTFTKEGMEVYRSFADEMAAKMNEQWEEGAMTHGNVSKDKRTMVR